MHFGSLHGTRATPRSFQLLGKKGSQPGCRPELIWFIQLGSFNLEVAEVSMHCERLDITRHMNQDVEVLEGDMLDLLKNRVLVSRYKAFREDLKHGPWDRHRF